MLGATTATTSASATSLQTLPMSLPSIPETNSIPPSLEQPTSSPGSTMPSFTPGQCLFCPISSPSFDGSVIHMQKSHGLFVPQKHLLVDLETFFRYLHLVVFGYRECIHCGTERATVQAVQQHMTGKGHCNFDLSIQESEFADFYSFSEPEEVADSDTETDDNEWTRERETTSSSLRPTVADEDSIRLPSGKIISKQSSTQTGPSIAPTRRRTRPLASQLEYSVEEPDGALANEARLGSDTPGTQLLSKREKRERAIVTHRLANMSANDRNSLMHLPTSQQRAILATQHRHAEKVQKEERRRQAKVDRKGNKNLYAYWATETPVYQCG